jgi:hypothetical protein
MAICARRRSSRPAAILLAGVAGALALLASVAAQAPAGRAPAGWTIPRTPDGRPDLQGNWTYGTMTPIQRPPGQAKVLTREQVAAIEQGRTENIEKLAQPSDPNRPAPPVGGDGSTGAYGNVGGYNYFWIDAGDRVAIVNGEARSSLIVDPADGRIPAPTPAASEWAAARTAFTKRFGEFDNPENRPLGERCLMSFGSNAGPPILPNYFYNNNATIVQTKDHVMIMAEMVHDVRVIRMGGEHIPAHLRPWMGDSIGRWEGDTLVVETTNIHPRQTLSSFVSLGPAIGSTDNLKVVERFTRTGPGTILYQFTVDDPTSYTAPWSGEVPMLLMDDLIHEYACHEGNYALSNVLSGARAQEREAAKKSPPQE